MFVVCAANVAFFSRFVPSKTKDLRFSRRESAVYFSIFAITKKR